MIPFVSIIIPTFHHCGFVVETLNSIFAQSFADYEIVVVNDGSPDRTAEVLRPIAAAGRIRYFDQENQGQAAARNRGLAEATGEFVAFLDDDDLWPADKLQWQVARLNERPDLAAVAGQAVFLRDDQVQWQYPQPALSRPLELTFEALFDGNPIFSPGQVLMRRQAIAAIGGFNRQVWGADDFDLWFRLARVGAIEVSPRIALIYRLHAGNASKNFNQMFCNCIRVIDENAKFLAPTVRSSLRRKGRNWARRGAASVAYDSARAAARERNFGRSLSSLRFAFTRDPAFVLGSLASYLTGRGSKHKNATSKSSQAV